MTNPGTTVDASGELVDFIAGLRFEDIPAEVVEDTKLHLLDTLGVAAAGATAEGMDLLFEQVTHWGGRPEAHLLGTDIKVPAPWAGLLNGSLIHAKEFEDVHEAAFVRPAGSVIAAALAAAELNPAATGEDLIAGIVGGYEYICRVGRAIEGPISFTRSGALGSLGSAAAASRVLGLDAERARHAVGIAYAQTSTSIQAQLDAAMVKKMHPGIGAHAGLIGVALAARGMTGNVNVLEGPYGYLHIYEPHPYDRGVIVDGLGSSWEVSETGYKMFPSAIYTHAPVQAALSLHREGIDAGRIRRVQFAIAEFAAAAGAKTFDEVEKHPTLEAMFSVPYLAAAGFVHGHVGLEDLLAARVLDPTVADLARRIDVVVDPKVPAEALVPITMVVELEDGETIERTVDVLPGSPRDTIDAGVIERKARSCFAYAQRGPWGDVDVDKVIAVVQRLESSTAPAQAIVAVLQ